MALESPRSPRVGREGGRVARGIAGSCPLVSRVTAPVLRARARISSLVRKGGCRGEPQAQPTCTHSHARTYAPGTHARTHARTHAQAQEKVSEGRSGRVRTSTRRRTATNRHPHARQRNSRKGEAGKGRDWQCRRSIAECQPAPPHVWSAAVPADLRRCRLTTAACMDPRSYTMCWLWRQTLRPEDLAAV